MTVSTELSHEEYVGNGVTTDFDFRFRIFESKHLIVVVADSDGIETTLKNGTDYTIFGAGSYHGGKVVLNKPLAQGWKILLERDLPVVQETDLRNQGKFFAEVHEDAFDYLTMLIQKALGTFSLSLRKPTYLSNYYDAKGNRIANLAPPKFGSDSANKDYVDNSIKDIDSKTLRVKDKPINALPNTEQRANKILAFDDNGQPITVLPESGSASDVFIELAKPTGANLIGGFDKKASLAAGAINAKTFGVLSGADNILLLQELQDLSEELQTPIDFSGINIISFSGHISIGDYFHWKGSDRNQTIIKPISLTRNEVGTNGHEVYAWFQRKDANKNLYFAMLEDIGFDGQYQGGYEIVQNGNLQPLVKGFCWHANNNAVLTDITAMRCHFKNMPHEAWEGYTTNSGRIDGIRYLFCSSEGVEPSLTAGGFNAFKCMNGSIDSPSEYGVYTIKNIVCFGSTAKGHRTLADLKRGCEMFSVSQCTTYDMNDCHHSTDGSRNGTFFAVQGVQTGASYRTKNFIEIQGEDITVDNFSYDANTNGIRTGVAGVLITQYQYPSLTGECQSKNIAVTKGNIKNINQHAVRFVNCDKASVDNIYAENCVSACSFERDNKNKDAYNSVLGTIRTKLCDMECFISTTYPVVLTSFPISIDNKSRLNNTTSYPSGSKFFPITGINVLNHDILLKDISNSSSVTPPLETEYAIELTDVSPTEVTKFLVSKVLTTGGSNIYLKCWVKLNTSAGSCIAYREIDKNGVEIKTTYRPTSAYGKWEHLYQIFRLSENTHVVEVYLCPSCDSSGNVSLIGKSQFSELIISNYPI